ncbi:hypothetical protein GGI04_001500 [Coemansia thaxteri]|uniref:Uncharacterized protein n=1 Tax=Coemansia thaxteri TaxID=2663907 RepID=A0A9W8BM94_9FUNG|nr:hypothetical protein H4R26_001765 [Coemansia thaxteri]KAJ2007509.1 hypothetical protein GGI04_001500 [Coemansia thaxteri]KAJ2472628.1 hypothetical protein GGI02_001441 [Coemansia sp. RSA 2322]
MIVGVRVIACIAAIASLFAAQTAGAAPRAKKGSEGIAIGHDGIVIADKPVDEVTKESFLEYLDTKQSMLIGFYQLDKDESSKVLYSLNAFAKKAAARYPDLQVGKVDFKQNPYLTARMLLTGIPEMRLLIKGQGMLIVLLDTDAAYNLEVIDDAEELMEYMDNQLWLNEVPLGSQEQMYCSPFNFCGKMLGLFADKSSKIESVLPIPKWLALILIPALITFAGRFIIDGMYSAEEQIRNLLGRTRDSGTTVTAAQSVTEDSEPAADADASNSRNDASQAKQPKKKKTQ